MASPIAIHCPKCKSKLKIPNRKSVGRKVRCPSCEQPFVIRLPKRKKPAPETVDLDDFGSSFDEGFDDDSDSFDDDFTPPPGRNVRPARSRRKNAGRSRAVGRNRR